MCSRQRSRSGNWFVLWIPAKGLRPLGRRPVSGTVQYCKRAHYNTHTHTLCWSNLMLHCVNNSICHNGISLMKQRYRFKIARLSRVLDHKGRCSCDAPRTFCYPRRIVWTFLYMTDFCIYLFSSHWRDWKHEHTCQVTPKRVTVYS